MRRVFVWGCMVGALLGLSLPATAQQVMVSPGSIIFEGRDRGGEVFVANTGDSIATYRLEPTHFVMREDGTLVEVEGDPPADSAVDMLRFSPRQFQLRPGESQTVRLAVRKPASLAPGEYRAHLKVINLGAVAEEPTVEQPDGTLAQINLRVTRAIRVVVRHNITGAEATIGELSATRGEGGLIELSFQVSKQGGSSSRGEYAVFVRDSSGTTTETLVHRGVIVYPELQSRQVSLAVPAEKLTGAAELCVSYRNTEGGQDGSAQTRCVDPGSL